MKLKNKYSTLSCTQRLYGIKVPIIAFTGGIATGKSQVTAILRKHGAFIIDADQLVKEVYSTQEAFDFISKQFPEAIENDVIHFPSLRNIFFNNSNTQQKIENFIYPRIEKLFYELTKQSNENYILYDVPLLFEKELHTKVDFAVCTYCPEELQIKRLLSRDKITMTLAKKILINQVPIEEKKVKADYVLNNYHTLLNLEDEIRKLMTQLFNN